MEKIEISACADHHFIMPIGVMMYSVCKNNEQGTINFHIIIDESVTPEDQQKLKNTVTPFNDNVFFYSMTTSQFIEFPSQNSRQELSKATYYRLFLGEILPSTITKTLYLDGDVIVRHSLEDLWNTDMKDCAIAGVNHPEIIVSGFFSRLGYPAELGYFNAGVLLINLDKWRKTHVVNRFMDFMKQHSDGLLAHDQDVLNYVFKEDKITLPCQYNLMSCFLYQRVYSDEMKDAASDTVIVHYLLDKPWWVYNRHLHPYRSTFFKYQRQTLWKDEPLWEVRSLYVRVRKQIATSLRHIGILPELTSNGCEYMNLPPID